MEVVTCTVMEKLQQSAIRHYSSTDDRAEVIKS